MKLQKDKFKSILFQQISYKQYLEEEVKHVSVIFFLQFKVFEHISIQIDILTD